jgi:hypothetical protein
MMPLGDFKFLWFITEKSEMDSLKHIQGEQQVISMAAI